MRLLLTTALLLNYTLAMAQEIPIHNQTAIASIIDDYRAECVAKLGSDSEGDLIVAAEPTYEMVIDDLGTTATVLHTDFRCGDLGPEWCGTGGCNTYLVVDEKIFVWNVSFAPRTIKLPTYTDPVTAILFPLYGGYCKTASGESNYGTSPCYAIATWDNRRKTFSTISGNLEEYDPDGQW